ncbi:MAG: hypothetical protein Q8Q96_00845 [bacterium]|nr:hypothetical protein [bacterium]
MRKIFNLTSWILLFTLAPFAVLAFLSQNSVPGDLFYPVKRGLEGIVLAAASASPATRVAFRTDLTERRFMEAQKLLLAKADTTALGSFILEVQSTQGEIDALSNVLENQQSSEKLIAKIDDYQVKLTQLQVQTQSTTTPLVPSTKGDAGQPQTVQQQVPSISGGGQAGQSAVQQNQTGSTPLPQSTNPPQQPTVAVQNPPSQTAMVSPEQQRIVSETIVTTKIELERIKKDLEEKKREREERKPFDSAQDKEEKEEEKENRPERNGKRR